MPVEERIALSSPDGVGRVVAEGPELVARSDSEGEELWYCLCVLTTNMNMFLRKVT
jgi:hypothetical protein